VSSVYLLNGFSDRCMTFSDVIYRGCLVLSGVKLGLILNYFMDHVGSTKKKLLFQMWIW